MSYVLHESEGAGICISIMAMGYFWLVFPGMELRPCVVASLKILSLLSFCYFLIWTSNLSLKACCCYRRRLFLLSVFGIYVPTYVYHYILYAFMFSLTNISGTLCSKKRHFEYILKRASICHVYLWKPLQISSCLALIFLISSHRVAAKPATWGRCKCNRSFHSQDVSQLQIGRRF